MSRQGQGLRALEKGLPAGAQQLQRLHHELDFPDAPAPELHVALQFAGLDHLRLDAAFHGHDLTQHALVDGPRIAERLDHLQELRRQRCVARHAARLDQHHPLPGLAPLRVVVFVAGQRTAERPRIAFRAQAQINPVKRAFRGHAAHLRDEGLGQAIEELVVRQRRRGALLFAGGSLKTLPSSL